jgi:hypothetical protein
MRYCMHVCHSLHNSAIIKFGQLCARLCVRMCMYVFLDVYIYVCINTHTHTHYMQFMHIRMRILYVCM